jgi:hypothetical protein
VRSLVCLVESVGVLEMGRDAIVPFMDHSPTALKVLSELDRVHLEHSLHEYGLSGSEDHGDASIAEGALNRP